LTPLELVQKLITLTSTNIDLLVVSIPNANPHDTSNANVPARVANLLTWAQSGTGPGLQTVIETAQMLFPQLFLAPPKRPLKHLPYERNIFFTGREDVLQRLHQALAQNKNVALTQSIAGLGGIGKTQTAIEYAYRHWDDYDAIFWCPANSEITLNTAYRDIAIRLDLPQKDAQNPEDTNEAVKAWLAANPGYLLLFDNADELAIVEKYLPPHPIGHILITSRAHDFAVLNIKGPVRLHELPADEALAFLLQRTDRENTSETECTAAADLARELGYLPLALEQAAAYIAHNEISFTDYLVAYHRLRVELLEKHGPVTGNYSETVRTTWNKSFDAIREKSEAAAELLTLSAFFAPDAIPYELFLNGASQLREPLASQLADVPDNQLRLLELMSVLTDYSLIRRNAEARTYNIHRMVQEVIQAQMDDTIRQTLAERAVRVANRAFPYVKFEDWPLCERLLPHTLHLAIEIENMNMEFYEAARLLNQSGLYLQERALYPRAEPMFVRALAINERMLGVEHPDTVFNLNNLATLYYKQGLYAQAETLLVRALAIREKELGPEHPNIATSLNNLALLYQTRGLYVQAKSLLVRALAIREKALGVEHLDTVLSLNNLAGLYSDQGQFAQAEPLYIRALAIHEKVLGLEHPDTATSLNNLAALYRTQGLYERAEPLYVRSLAIYEKALGPEHPNTATSLNNLANLYYSQGKFVDAEPLFKRVIGICEKVLGRAHPLTAAGYEDFANVLRELGKEEEAREMDRRAQEIMSAHRRQNIGMETTE